MTKEALKLALEALCVAVEPKKGKVYAREFEPIDCFAMHEQAITAIKEALAQPEQEPVAWAMLHDNGHFIDAIHPDEHARVEGKYTHPLYTTKQRTWVGLTDEEVGDLSDFAYTNDEEFVRNVEAKLKEKNT